MELVVNYPLIAINSNEFLCRTLAKLQFFDNRWFSDAVVTRKSDWWSYNQLKTMYHRKPEQIKHATFSKYPLVVLVFLTKTNQKGSAHDTSADVFHTKHLLWKINHPDDYRGRRYKSFRTDGVTVHLTMVRPINKHIKTKQNMCVMRVVI